MNEACHLLCNGWSATTSLFISATWPGSRRGEARRVDQKFVEKEIPLPPLFPARFHDHAKDTKMQTWPLRSDRMSRSNFYSRQGLEQCVCVCVYTIVDAWKRVNWNGREGEKVFSRDREESMGPIGGRGEGRRPRCGEASVALLFDGDR